MMEQALKTIAYADPDRTHASALVNIARAALGLPLLPETGENNGAGISGTKSR